MNLIKNKIIPEIKVTNQEKFNCICDKYFIHDVLKQIKITFISVKD